jgi:hypothetical protein
MDTETTMSGAKSRRGSRIFLTILLLLIAVMVGYVELALHWSYSDGDRVGVLQKISRKGWACKTYEGELGMYVVAGLTPQIWSFTVRDAAVAQRLNANLGQRVRLHYTEHRGLPTSCFGDTGYFVDGVSPAPL